jgi:uncharacterized protein (TIGR02996 family)
VPFLRELAASSDDATARLVYADWLQEHGEDDRAARMRPPRCDGRSLAPGRWSVCRRESRRHPDGTYTVRLRRITIQIERVTDCYAVLLVGDRLPDWTVRQMRLDTLTQCYRLEETQC